MTISNTTWHSEHTTTSGQYGASYPFNLGFTIWDSSDLVVHKNSVLLTETTDYVVTSDLTQVYLVDDPAASHTLELWRMNPLTNSDVDLRETGNQPSATIEEGIDRLVAITQRCIGRLASDPDVFDAQSLRITAVATPSESTDAVNKAYADGIAAAAGSVPTPGNPGEDGYHLVASGGTYAWTASLEVPFPADPGDDGKYLSASGGAASWTTPANDDYTEPVAGDVPWTRPLTASTTWLDELRFARATAADTNDWATPGTDYNAIINGGMTIDQRRGGDSLANPNVNDLTTFAVDRWRVIHDATTEPTVQRIDTGSQDGISPSFVRLTAAEGKKMGIMQVIPNDEIQNLNKRRVSLSFWAKSNAITDVQAVLLNWTGMADAAGGTDPVSSGWNADGADPSFDGAGYAVLNSAPTDFTITTTWKEFVLEGVEISSGSMTNLVVAIYGNTVANTDQLDITGVRLTPGSDAKVYQPYSMAYELMRCKRFYQKSYDLDAAPGDVTDLGTLGVQPSGTSNPDITGGIQFSPPMITQPTVTLYSPGTGASGNIEIQNGTPADVTAAAGNIGVQGCKFSETTAGSHADGTPVWFHYVAEGEI